MMGLSITRNFANKLIILIGLSLSISIFIAVFQPFPGYMDADYYFSGGVQLAQGKGFSEPYLWNYFDPSNTIPHPSHGYWMPLASMVAALGMVMTGSQSWLAGRIFFFIVTITIPPLTALLAYSFTKREDLSFLSGIIAIFSGYYAIYMQLTETFSINMLLGVIFFLIAHRKNNITYFFMGILSGLFHLARADGLLWLVVSFIIISLNYSRSYHKLFDWIKAYSINLLGYLLVIGPWFIRNYQAFGSLFGPMASDMMWLTHYNQIFSFPPVINFSSWWNQGVNQIIATMISAIKLNLLSTLAVQGNIIFIPLILIGAWRLKKDPRIVYSLIAWIGIFSLMSIVYPFAGMRGGFFHAGSALQPIFWSMIPVGLVTAVEYLGTRRKWDISSAKKVFTVSIVALSIIFTSVITVNKLYDSKNHVLIWGMEEINYRSINSDIKNTNSENIVVMVNNPPGFFLATGNYAIPIPDGDINNLTAAASEFNANYLILEPDGYPEGLDEIYSGEHIDSRIVLINKFDGLKLYEINLDE